MSRKGTQVTTGMVRLSYVNIFEPKAIGEGQEPKYSMSLLIPKSDTKTIGEIRAAIEEAKQYGLREKWQGKVPQALHYPLRDGDEERSEDENYVGHYFINTTSRHKPLIIDGTKADIMDPDEVYSGCFGKVVLNFFAYSAPNNQGMSACLLGVQKLAEGEPLGGVGITPKAFDEEEEELDCLR